VIYTFPSLLRSPLITAIFFLFFTILSMLFFFLFRGMAYCKYICPIGSVNTAFARTSPVWLSTYEEECKSCKKPDCALACPYELNPSKFEERKSMMNCTMCMECAHACDAVKLEFRKFGIFPLRKDQKSKNDRGYGLYTPCGGNNLYHAISSWTIKNCPF
jgi:polyferredoxin